jgi:hypothetical protein
MESRMGGDLDLCRLLATIRVGAPSCEYPFLADCGRTVYPDGTQDSRESLASPTALNESNRVGDNRSYRHALNAYSQVATNMHILRRRTGGRKRYHFACGSNTKCRPHQLYGMSRQRNGRANRSSARRTNRGISNSSIFNPKNIRLLYK